MIFPVNPQLQLSGNKMEKSNYKEWSVDFNGKIIKVSNWWNWEGKCSADLYLDNEQLDNEKLDDEKLDNDQKLDNEGQTRS